MFRTKPETVNKSKAHFLSDENGRPATRARAFFGHVVTNLRVSACASGMCACVISSPQYFQNQTATRMLITHTHRYSLLRETNVHMFLYYFDILDEALF